MTRTFDSLIPSIEQRETAWLQLRERLKRSPRQATRPTITISREYGCEGYPLAELLKIRLESATDEPWNIFDKALVAKVASDDKLSSELLTHLGDESQAMDVLRTHFGYLTHNEAYAVLVKHLVQIAATGNAIIVGRGAAVACQDLKNCFHFRLEGSFAFRVSTLAQRLGIPPTEAETIVRTQSKLREKFISECLQQDITSPHWYDAVFNNERQSLEAIARAAFELIHLT
ncbi:MAG: cytidylate kinase-like family protein [Holophaga sp.]|nr:cytidylate kinase-like family protein [Holophaga sp.]